MNFESVALKDGSIGRLRCPPRTTLILPTDIGSTVAQRVCVLYVLAGAVHMTHMRHRGTAQRGTIVAFDGTAAIKTHGSRPSDIVTLEVPAARLAPRRRDASPRAGLRLFQETSSSPLAACMRHLAEHLNTTSPEQLGAIYDACVSLLVAEESLFDTAPVAEPGRADRSPLLRDIIDHINRNIGDATLAPPGVARTLGISVRYLHKLFAASGVTFGAYVAGRRLDHVRNALVAESDAARSIAQLARDWGFRDISAFNRAFRKRFGCAPRRMRARGLLGHPGSHPQSGCEPTWRLSS